MNQLKMLYQNLNSFDKMVKTDGTYNCCVVFLTDELVMTSRIRAHELDAYCSNYQSQVSLVITLLDSAHSDLFELSKLCFG